MSQKQVLSPHHFGEALVSELLKNVDVDSLKVYDPGSGKDVLIRAAIGSQWGEIVEIRANEHLTDSSSGPKYDGMHDIDCAIIFENAVIAIELKLGQTRLLPTDFCKRFTSKVPKMTHENMRVGGSMVALLDWNGRNNLISEDQPKIDLFVGSKVVNHSWLLLVREAVLKEWRKEVNLASILGTSQLAGIFTLEGLAKEVDLNKARDIAKELVNVSIDSWFKGDH